MNLKDYISSILFADASGIEEAISSGANTPKFFTLNDMIGWLKKLGVTKCSSGEPLDAGMYFVTKSSRISGETILYAMSGNKNMVIEIIFNTADKKVKEINIFNPSTGKTLEEVVNGSNIEYLDIMDKFEKTFKKK